MNFFRSIVLQWAEAGRISSDRLPQALAVARVTPDSVGWYRFLDRLLLWSGVVFLAAAIIFFIAYNWNDLGRYAKFVLVEVLIAAGIIAYARLGPDNAAAKVALVFAAIMVGVLLALFGQTYQTGADTWELFATWAGFILPWVLVGRLPALWIVWLVLVNIGVELYFQTFPRLLGILVDSQRQLWALFTLNTIALALWEAVAGRRPWLNERWAVRLLALISGGLITALVLTAIFEAREASRFIILVYPLWLVMGYIIYRHTTIDLFMLTVMSFSVIVSVTAFLSHAMLSRTESGTFLLLAFLVLCLSSAAAVWLRRVAAERRG